MVSRTASNSSMRSKIPAGGTQRGCGPREPGRLAVPHARRSRRPLEAHGARVVREEPLDPRASPAVTSHRSCVAEAVHRLACSNAAAIPESREKQRDGQCVCVAQADPLAGGLLFLSEFRSGTPTRAGRRSLAELIHELRREGVRSSKKELIEMCLSELPAAPTEELRTRLRSYRAQLPRDL